MTAERSTTRTPLAQLLAEHVRERGAIPFAEYMRECLYHPDFGYYSRAGASRFADYYTSVDVHPIFGRLLARQLDQMWTLLGRPRPFWVVEAGAGSGRLAKHVLDFAARQLRDFYGALRNVPPQRTAAHCRSRKARARRSPARARRVARSPRRPPRARTAAAD